MGRTRVESEQPKFPYFNRTFIGMPILKTMKNLLSLVFRYSLLLSLLLGLAACAPFNITDILPSWDSDPSESPLNNPQATYTISSSAHSLRPFTIEDTLLIFINGRAVQQYHGREDKSPLAPVSFKAHIGSSIYVQLANAGFGSSCGLDNLYLHKEDSEDGSSSQLLATGFQRRLCQDGVVFSSESITLN